MLAQISGDLLGCQGRPRPSRPGGDYADGRDNLAFVEIEFVEQEVIKRLPAERCRQCVRREVRKVIGDDHIGAASSGGCDHMSVVRIRQVDR